MTRPETYEAVFDRVRELKPGDTLVIQCKTGFHGPEFVTTRKRKRPGSDDPTKNQLGGFHKGGPSTERSAALDNYPRSGTQKETILVALATTMKNGTADEVREHTGLRFNTTAARLHDLKEAGWLEIVGERPSATGSMSSVFALSPAGREWFDGRLAR